MASGPLQPVIDDLASLVRPGGVLLVGEFHGTEQFPSVVADLVRVAAADGLAVTVGLEIPCSEQERLDAVVADPLESVRGPWWHREPGYRDGRSSRAMAELVRSLGRVRASGGDVAVVAMDGPWVAPGSPIPLELLGQLEQDRDEGMAMRLLDAIDRRRRAFTVVLAGNEHTGVVPRSSPLPERPLGSFVRPWHRGVVALMGRSAGGAAWFLPGQGDAGEVREVAGGGDGLPPGAMWAPEPGEDGHHGYLHVGAVTASRPHGEDPEVLS